MELLTNPGATKGPITMQNAAVALGNGTAIDVTKAGKGGYAVLTMQVVIATTAVVTFEGTIDGSNWVSIMATNMTTDARTATVTNAAASGLYQINVLGLASVRARVSTWTAGAVTVKGQLVA